MVRVVIITYSCRVTNVISFFRISVYIFKLVIEYNIEWFHIYIALDLTYHFTIFLFIFFVNFSWSGVIGWGIAWYINGFLIPEITVTRGVEYTFSINGGNDPSVPAIYHPFYITNSPRGGYSQLTPAQQQVIKTSNGDLNILYEFLVFPIVFQACSADIPSNKSKVKLET